MSAPACGNCLFWDAGTSKAFPTVDGMCRRYAPQGPTLSSEGSGRGWQIFPPMQAHQWCGDYRPDPQHVASAKAAAA